MTNKLTKEQKLFQTKATNMGLKQSVITNMIELVPIDVLKQVSYKWLLSKK